MFSVRRDFFVLAVLFFGCQLGAVCQSKEAVEPDQEYSNEYFSVKYPSSWLLDDSYDTIRLVSGVTIRDFNSFGTDYYSNVLIYVSKEKVKGSPEYIAESVKSYLSLYVDSFKALKIENLTFSGCSATVMEYIMKMDGRKLKGVQYTIKRSDDTLYYITITCLKKNFKKVSKTTNKIVDSITIK